MPTEKILMICLSITNLKKRDSIVADYLATVKRLQHIDINERAQDLLRQDDLNRMFEPVIETTGKSTCAITEELVQIREEMKTLNVCLADTTEKMKGAITMKQQQPTDDHTSIALEQYLLKYGGSINILLFNMLVITSMRWVIKQLKLMKILTSL